jgi:hypothetical protein
MTKPFMTAIHHAFDISEQIDCSVELLTPDLGGEK